MCSVKKVFLEYFAKFTGKQLCQSLLFNKVACTGTLVQVFSCEFSEISKKVFSYRTPPVATSVSSLFMSQKALWQLFWQIENNPIKSDF